MTDAAASFCAAAVPGHVMLEYIRRQLSRARMAGCGRLHGVRSGQLPAPDEPESWPLDTLDRRCNDPVMIRPAEEYEDLVPVRRAALEPPLPLPPGFDPDRLETWPKVAGRLEYVDDLFEQASHRSDA